MSLYTLMLIHLVAVASPGLGFAVVFRHTLNFSFRNGVVTALGIACGDLVLIWISVFGSAFLIAKNPEVLRWIQMTGAAYLTYLGFQAFRAFFRFLIQGPPNDGEHAHAVSASYAKSWVDGFVTTLGNPKAIIYFISISSQFMKPGQTRLDLFLLIFALIGISFVWFSTVSAIIGSNKVRPRFMKYRYYCEGVMGVVLVLFGIYFLMHR